MSELPWEIVYGVGGRPVGSIDDEAVFDCKGNQLLVHYDGHLFLASDGSFAGSYVEGVIFNANGKPQGFTKGATQSVPMAPPQVGTAPPLVRRQGDLIENEPVADIPEFLLERLSNSSAFIHGIFI